MTVNEDQYVIELGENAANCLFESDTREVTSKSQNKKPNYSSRIILTFASSLGAVFAVFIKVFFNWLLFKNLVVNDDQWFWLDLFFMILMRLPLNLYVLSTIIVTLFVLLYYRVNRFSLTLIVSFVSIPIVFQSCLYFLEALTYQSILELIFTFGVINDIRAFIMLLNVLFVGIYAIALFFVLKRICVARV